MFINILPQYSCKCRDWRRMESWAAAERLSGGAGFACSGLLRALLCCQLEKFDYAYCIAQARNAVREGRMHAAQPLLLM
ncbi:MAG TPA: hypothetical protein VJ752_17545 [Burkholderiaceae bacterium]|nr:hypothetical protein [Burkholderiaceae bacterium]